ncbi:MAG: DUF2088 domain-containing protein [Planctomycetia bacterium]|nr:DUF2088 domain-containing protein [Planctomycetia bacterium]
MIARVRYGLERSLELDLADDRLIAACGIPAERPLPDVREAALAALRHPLAFPPLVQATVPGDRVVLALECGVPRAGQIVAAVFDCLVERDVDPGDVTLLTPESHAAAGMNPRDLVPPSYRDRAKVLVHDPDKDKLSYLAVGTDNEPIYLNRALCDADLVIPIGCLRCEPALGYHGVHGGLFPTFSSRKTQKKLLDDSFARVGRGEVRGRKRVCEVGWLLGVQFTVQVVPGPGGEVLNVLAGLPSDVFRDGQSACQQAWTFPVPREAQLVVAAIDGDAEEHTWDNVARALAAALRVVAADGAIALVTALADAPAPALRQCGEASDPRQLLRHIRRGAPADFLPAAALAHALDQARLYMLSGLPDAAVEELGIVPLANGAELARLAGRHASCIVLSNAQYAVPRVGASDD